MVNTTRWLESSCKDWKFGEFSAFRAHWEGLESSCKDWKFVDSVDGFSLVEGLESSCKDWKLGHGGCLRGGVAVVRIFL